MKPILIIVVQVILQDPSEMSLIQGNDVVQNLPPTTSDPSLRKPILPGCTHTGAFRLQACSFEEADHLRIELSIPIEKDVTIAARFWKASRSC